MHKKKRKKKEGRSDILSIKKDMLAKLVHKNLVINLALSKYKKNVVS